MKKQNSTKKALICSVLALVLCCSMLVGTTFAWFTDSVTSKGNIIQTGSLDVEMFWTNANVDVPAKGDDAWIDASAGAMFNNTLWEPGYVEAKHIMVANEGTLAFNYKLRIVANGVVSKLADVIDVYVVGTEKDSDGNMIDATKAVDRDNLGTWMGTLTQVLGSGVSSSNALYRHVNGSLQAGETDTWTLVLKMRESAGNEYQNLSIGTSFSVELLATQMASEEDSFGADYDAKVPDPEIPAALVRPLENLTINATINDFGNSVPAKEITLNTAYRFEPTIFNEYPDGNSVYDDVDSSFYKQWHADFYVYADRDIPAGSIGLAGSYEEFAPFNNNNWVAITNEGEDMDIPANEGVRLLYSMFNNPCVVTYKNLCQYANDGIGFECGAYAIDAAALAGTTITVELRLYETNVDWTESSHGGCEETGKYEIVGTFNYTFPQPVSTTDELNELLAAGGDLGTIQLTDDLVGDVVVPQNSEANVIIDGNGHTIEGSILVDGKSATITSAGLTIKNLNFKADSISADACIQLGQSGNNNTRYTCNVTVENCTFDVPGAVGVKSYTGGDKNLTIINCTATENAHSLAQLKGIDGVLVKDCTVNSVRGINFNNSLNVVVENCTIDVQKYAVRFGESNNTIVENYEIIDSTIVSDNVDNDAAIVLRAGATNANLTITNTTVTAGVEMSGHEDANVIIK